MSRFLANLAAKSVGARPVLTPRPLSLFEPEPAAAQEPFTPPPVPEASHDESMSSAPAPVAAPPAEPRPASGAVAAPKAAAPPPQSEHSAEARKEPSPAAAPRPTAQAPSPRRSPPAALPAARTAPLAAQPRVADQTVTPVPSAQPAPPLTPSVHRAEPVHLPDGKAHKSREANHPVADLRPTPQAEVSPSSAAAPGPRHAGDDVGAAGTPDVQQEPKAITARPATPPRLPAQPPAIQAEPPPVPREPLAAPRAETTNVPASPPLRPATPFDPLAAATAREPARSGDTALPADSQRPSIEVRIGRLEIHAAPAPQKPEPRPGPTLDAFLTGGRR